MGPHARHHARLGGQSSACLVLQAVYKVPDRERTPPRYQGIFSLASEGPWWCRYVTMSSHTTLIQYGTKYRLNLRKQARLIRRRPTQPCPALLGGMPSTSQGLPLAQCTRQTVNTVGGHMVALLLNAAVWQSERGHAQTACSTATHQLSQTPQAQYSGQGDGSHGQRSEGEGCGSQDAQHADQEGVGRPHLHRITQQLLVCPAQRYSLS